MNVFLVTKPLQFMVCAALSAGHNLNGELYVVNNFYGANEFCKNKNVLHFFQSVRFFNKSAMPYLSLIGNKKIERLFIDSDYGLKKNIYLFFLKIFNWKIEIHIYEEGNGIYRKDLTQGRVRKIMYTMLNLKGYLGGSYFIKNIYVTNKERYVDAVPETNKKVVSIGGFSIWIKRNVKVLISIFGVNFTGLDVVQKKCNIYVTSWKIDHLFLEKLYLEKEVVYIKPHPHLKDIDVDKYDNVINPGTPLEVVLLEAMNKFDFIDVYHAGTSAKDYVKDGKINYIDIRFL